LEKGGPEVLRQDVEGSRASVRQPGGDTDFRIRAPSLIGDLQSVRNPLPDKLDEGEAGLLMDRRTLLQRRGEIFERLPPPGGGHVSACRAENEDEYSHPDKAYEKKPDPGVAHATNRFPLQA